jgi:hypothetical protein
MIKRAIVAQRRAHKLLILHHTLILNIEICFVNVGPSWRQLPWSLPLLTNFNPNPRGRRPRPRIRSIRLSPSSCCSFSCCSSSSSSRCSPFSAATRRPVLSRTRCRCPSVTPQSRSPHRRRGRCLSHEESEHERAQDLILSLFFFSSLIRSHEKQEARILRPYIMQGPVVLLLHASSHLSQGTWCICMCCMCVDVCVCVRVCVCVCVCCECVPAPRLFLQFTFSPAS